MTRLRALYILGAIAAVAVGCQSVATTSAKLRNQEQNYPLAIKLCNDALASNPNDAEAYFQRGFAYSQLDSVALAYQDFTKAKNLDPKKTEDANLNIQHNYAKHYKLGQSSFNRDDYKSASFEFGMAAKADPTQSAAHYNLAVAYARLADDDSTYHAKALKEADKVLELSNPSEANYAKALTLAGRELVALGREDEAENRFRRLIEEDPANYEVIQSMGMDLLTAEKWKAAAIFLKLAAEARSKIGSEDFNVYYNIGVAFYRLGHVTGEDPARTGEAMAYYDESIAYYGKALNITPDDPTTVFNVMVACVARENWAGAVQWGEKYVNVSPSDDKGWKLLARCYSELGEKEKADEAMKRYLMLSGQGQ